MKVTLAKSAGFCYGVRRAVELAEKKVADGPVFMLGPIIHNDHVIRSLEERGAVCVNSVEEIPEGASVILRSHGEPRAVHEELEKRNARIFDAACAHVTRIHKIVRDAEERGRIPVIVGTPDHPEVTAIAGWCRGGVVVRDADGLGEWLAQDVENRTKPLTFVSQTTSTRAVWEKCIEKAKKECTNPEIFDTICSATATRQSEAQELARVSDAMIIIGDRRSSNTKRLTQLCRDLCPRVIQVEGADELDRSMFAGIERVGITAGASTPGWIIKEVYDKMSDEIMEIEESFAELLEKSIKTLNTGEKVTGVVVKITNTEVQLDLGTKHAAYIPVAEMTDDPTVKVEDMVKVGDEIEAYVMRVNDVEGVATLSKKRLDTVKNWEEIEAAVESREIKEGVVTGVNKGGVEVSVKGIRVFVPASQSGEPRGADLENMMKQKVQLRITEVNRARRRVVGSIRAVAAEARAAKAAAVWEGIEEGKRYTGTVKSLTSYGAFVDIGGVDGMVHVSELSWSRIKVPSEVVSVGDTVEVYVISFDAEKKKISLGMKDHAQEPWTKFVETCNVGDVVNVRIVKLMTFGAFAEVVPGVDGLIHISQLADHRVEKVADVVTEGQQVDVKITAIDTENRKVSLSIRALLEPAAPAAEEAEEEAAAEE